jgi:cell division protein FtsB
VALKILNSLRGKTRVILFFAFVVAALYLLAITPVRTYISQRHQMAQQERRYQILADANASMRTRVTQLESASEVARLARQQYELVPPGQEAFAVMPPPPSVTQNQSSTTPRPPHESLFSRVMNDVEFWN